MVSDKPRDGRCGARVTDKVGLDIYCGDDEDFLYDDTVIDAVLLADGATVCADADYEDVRQYLWDDYEVIAVALGPTNADELEQLPDDELPPAYTEQCEISDIPIDDTTAACPNHATADDTVWFDLRDVPTRTTNARAEHQGYCERYPMDNGLCYVHQGGGAPEGNHNAMKHGLYAQNTTFYNSLDQHDKEFIEALVDSWLDQSPYNRDNVGVVNELYRAAIEQVRAWFGVDEFVDEDGNPQGLVTEQPARDEEGNVMTGDDGEPITIDVEHPANLPYSRLDRDIQSKLKDLNVYESPESEQATATESLAQKLSGMTDT